MFDLRTVTLVCIDTNHPEAGAHSVAESRKSVKFGRILFVGPRRPATIPDEAQFIQVAPFPDVRDYSRFVLSKLPGLIQTSHCLIVQHDGFVRNPQAWTDDFLKYDFIGAPWWERDRWVVGNGGFSLRSKRFLEAASTLPFKGEYIEGEIVPPPEECEDWFCTMTHRSEMEAKGITFAPVPLAMRFSVEYELPNDLKAMWPNEGRDTFGFHSWKRSDVQHLKPEP
jgi:hypothetical protein